MVAARYAGEPITGRMTIRDRYDAPPPKPGAAAPSEEAVDARRGSRAKATATHD